LEQRVEVLCCTPTYAMHLAASAASQQLDLAAGSVRKIIVAGEPGGSLPGVRRQIEEAWPAAELIDHYGLTEVGPVAFARAGEPGQLVVLEQRYFPEVLHPSTLQPVASGECGELVLTPLGRSAWPIFRYRTGDLVRPRQADLGLVFEGGILGRVDDMVVVRGVNLYPGAVEDVVRSVVGLSEYRVSLSGGAGLVQIELEIEATSAGGTALSPPVTASTASDISSAGPPPAGMPGQSPRDSHSFVRGRESDGPIPRLEAAFERAFSLRIPVREVPYGTLPRFELKSRRWVRVDHAR
jgi:phenylacetate-CoA ligase